MGERRCLGAGEYADAFFWLSDACISCTCYGVGDPAVGLSSTADEGSFKCYMADAGLLVAQLFADSEQTPHEVYRDVLLGKLETNEGMFAENAVAQQLVAGGRRLFFYSRRDDAASENTMEVDFLISKGYDDAAGRMRVSPVEVKSTKRYGTRSLEKFKAKFGGRVGTQYWEGRATMSTVVYRETCNGMEPIKGEAPALGV